MLEAGPRITMKTLIRQWTPRFVFEQYRRLKRLRAQARNRGRSIEEVFTEIYETNQWGGAAGEFCSGTGTADAHTVAAYVAAVTALADTEGFRGRDFVDLGCGDFRVGRDLLPLCSRYTGVDVVKALIEQHRQAHGGPNAAFLHLDIVHDDLPAGDVCFVRQVLQHLSNAEISAVLAKLARYSWVFITEHYPTDNPRIRPNRDKVHGGDVRVYENSGVYLTEPPFNLPEDALRLVLEVPGVGLGDDGDPGVIRTFLYQPGQAADAIGNDENQTTTTGRYS